MKCVAINAGFGGNDGNKEINGIIPANLTLDISKIIYEKLKNNGIDVILLRSKNETISYSDRIKLLTKEFPDSKNTIVISNTLNVGNGINIIYPLEYNDKLSNLISDNISIYNECKYYQLRLPSNPIKDYYYITYSTPGYETIIISYGNLDNKNDSNILKDNYKEMADGVGDAILKYLGITVNDNLINYTVTSGDTLYSIAKKFSMSVDEIKKINNLDSNLIVVGKILKVNNISYYVVTSGDTLYSIAKKFNTTIDEIKNKNNLKSNVLSIGTKLII